MSIWFCQTLCLRHKQIHQIWEAGPWGWQAKKLRCWRESKSPCTSLPVGCQLADISFFSLKFWVPNACDTQNSGCIESPGAGEENIPKQSTKKYGKKKAKKVWQNDTKWLKMPKSALFCPRASWFGLHTRFLPFSEVNHVATCRDFRPVWRFTRLARELRFTELL